MTLKATLERFAYSPVGTFGRLQVGNLEWFTVERPWLNNQAQVSCIPEGTYTLKKRQSQVVANSTGGAYAEGWEVTKVPGRSYIMIHPGNTMSDLMGCIAPGKTLAYVAGKWAVGSSRTAFDELMRALAGETEWTLEIKQSPPATL